MKRIISTSLLLGTVLFSACRQEQPIDPADNGQKVVITEVSGSFMDEPETKTAFADGNVAHGSALHINWSAADMVNVWFNNTEAEVPFTSTNTAPASSVSFSGSLSVLTGTGEDGSDTADYMYGYYPYSEENTISNGVITATLPVEQVAVANNISNNLIPWAARSTNWALKFYNVGCWFRFKVSRDDIRYVELSGNNEEKIAGEYSIGFDDNSVPTIADCSNGAEVIRLNAPDNGTFATGTWYYIALLPTEFTEGFTLKAYTASQIGTFSTSASASFSRSSYGSYSSMASSMTFQDRPDIFTVGENKRVVFAPGNLMAKIGSYTPGEVTATASEWKFGEPTEVLGNANDSGNKLFFDGSADCVGKWVDHFAFQGASSIDDAQHRAHGLVRGYYNADYHGSVVDEPIYDGCWSGLTISNGEGYTWRPFSSAELINLIYMNNRSRCCPARIMDIEGFIILPDDFVDPQTNGGDKAIVTYQQGASKTDNSFDEAGWAAMSEAGAIFFPKADYWPGTDFQAGIGEAYWSEMAMNLDLSSGDGSLVLEATNRYNGCAVRLVRDVD